jgi:hypothetical protein
MQRGACEAVWLGVPIITSDWPLLKSQFSQGALHVQNTANSIRQAVLRLREEKHQLQVGILALQDERRLEWHRTHAALAGLIEAGQADRASRLAQRGAG